MSSADVTDVVDSLSDVAGLSSLAKKIKIDSNSLKVTKDREKVSGFRIMDTELLSKMLATLPCKNCCELNLEYKDSKKRKGLASYLVISSTSCNWESEFVTSERIGLFSEVNRRTGCGSLRFIMNMMPHPLCYPVYIPQQIPAQSCERSCL